MKGVVQAKRYVGELVRVLLGKEGQGTLKAHMVRGTVGSFALKVVSTLLAFGTSLLLARLLGAKEYGVYAYAISWASLLSVPAVMGLNTLLVREVAKYKALEDWGSLRGILRWSDRIVLLTSIGIAATFALIVWFLQGTFSPEVRSALWIAMGLVPLLSFLLLRQGGLQGLGHVVEAQVPQLFLLPATFLVLTVGVYFAFGLSGSVAVGLRSLAGLVAVIAALLLLRKYLPEPVTGVSPLYRQREWLRSAFPLLFVGAAGIVNQRLAVVILGILKTPEVAGILDIGLRGASFISFPLIAVTMPLAPLISELYVRGDIERLNNLVKKSVTIAFLGGIVMAALLLSNNDVFLGMFGSKFQRGSGAFIILGIGYVTSIALGPVATLLNMTGNERVSALGVMMGVLLTTLFCFLLIPFLSLEGAALAVILGELSWRIFLAVRSERLCEIRSGLVRFTKRLAK